NRLIDACLNDAVGGLLAHRLADTLKAAQPPGDAGAPARSLRTIERSDKWLAQTPQMFRLGLLERALREAGPQVTDEASAIEALGLQPLLVEGGAQNFKLTYPDDFALARAVLRSRSE
ncbi:MAG: IspD/TarI family cytidylyltransferase, partial [Burkholderiaceae bacterium]